MTTPSYRIQGREVTLPCEVRDASSGAATFLVSSAAARTMLPDAFDPAELLPGRALLSVAVIDYRDNDLGDYNEVSIAFFVRPAGSGHGRLANARAMLRGGLPTYIHWLPVDQAFTQEAGHQIWGFPKTVERIDFRYETDRARCRLEADGAHVLTLSLPRGGQRRMPDAALCTYTLIHGVAHRTAFVSGAEGFGIRRGGCQLELGGHPYSEGLRRLGLPKRPLMCTWMEHMHGRFEAPEKL